ncbi:MAG: hypothetical protein HYR96_16090 [Deltaproteobacteria bacterium]|nr:hypothetical protein [Deltaproteobacteria bacterium]MBI3293235.1 hypothetical protein [Deltaproteobacteria bacterium]
MKISGFTIVRNAQILDYPFPESIISILPLCDEVIVCVGDSQDQTLSLCRELAEKFPQVRLIETHWNTQNQKHGFQLSAQTNLCLSQCRNPWAFYIQADEVAHEEDFEAIRNAILHANRQPDVDGLVFDYLHFYGDYRHTISGRAWYRREVRLIKTGRGVQSFRDAQGFRKLGEPVQAMEANARIFHYGYVRTPESLRQKAFHMTQWWGRSPGEDFRLKNHIGIRPYKDSHPASMRDRVAAHPNDFHPARHPRVWDKRELKDLVTVAWETLVPVRIGEYRNFRLIGRPMPIGYRTHSSFL